MPSLTRACSLFVVLASALGPHAAVPRCTPESASTSCRATSPRGWRIVRLLRHGFHWDARKRARICFPGIVGKGRRDCCSTRRFGFQGNLQCWEDLPPGPWYHLCCGTQRVGPVRAADFALPVHTAPDVENTPLPEDLPCDFDETPYEDLCAVYFLCYHKTGNTFLRRLLPVIARLILKRPLFKSSWSVGFRGNTMASPFFAPITRLPVANAEVYQHLPEVTAPEWDIFEQPVPPVVVAHGEWIPAVTPRPRGQQVFRSARYRGRVVHFVRDPADLVASALRYHTRESLREHEHHAGFHGLRCYGCSIRAWHAIFRRCGYSCSYMALLSDTADRSPAAGLAMEYMRSQHMVRNMLSNMALWSNSSQVLHVTVDQMRRNFAKTMACLLAFMFGKRDRSDDRRWALPDEAIEGLVADINRTMDASGGHHGTHSDPRWRGVDLRGMLLRHPAWGGPLSAAGRLLLRIQRRQARLFGCPHPRCVAGACS